MPLLQNGCEMVRAGLTQRVDGRNTLFLFLSSSPFIFCDRRHSTQHSRDLGGDERKLAFPFYCATSSPLQLRWKLARQK